MDTHIDWKKPVQTISGLPVRILCTDADGEYPIVGLIDGDVYQWSYDGTMASSDGDRSDMELENAPPLEKFYINIHENGSYESDIQGLTYTPTTMAQIIVDPENKLIRFQLFNDTKLEGIGGTSYKLDGVVCYSNTPVKRSGGLMDNYYKTLKGNRSSIDLNKIEVVDEHDQK